MKGLLYALAGLLAGVLAGMGMGGGTLLIPALTLLLDVGQHSAQGANILSFLPASCIALWVHRKAGRLALDTCWPIILGGIAGAVAGAGAATLLPGAFLKKIFGAFLLCLGWMQWKKA